MLFDRKANEWSFYLRTFGSIFIDGEKSNARVFMRRRDNAKWVYRVATREEEEDFVSRDAW